MITFQREKWLDCVEEMRLLWPEHWAELAIDREAIPLGCDEAKYAHGCACGMLLLITAREIPGSYRGNTREIPGKIIGYYYGALMNHLHYKDAGLMCHSDVYFMKPEYRRGATGAQFMLSVLQIAKSLGVVKFYISTKVHQDHGELFEALGMKCSDRVFTKLL